MFDILLKTVLALAGCIVLYFLVVTRISLIINALTMKKKSASHVYWVYSNRLLIWLTDQPLIVSAILFFNYHRLVDTVIKRMNPSLTGKQVLQASCAFGNISEKIARKCVEEGARKVVIFDIMPNEITHTQRKLAGKKIDQYCRYLLEDATSIAHKDESFDYVVPFFLFHELPYEKKVAALKESMRVLKPGGKLIFGEFHRPGPLLLRFSGRCFFTIFEPYAREMWGKFDARALLDEDSSHQWECSKETFFFGNYQVFTAEKGRPLKEQTVQMN